MSKNPPTNYNAFLKEIRDKFSSPEFVIGVTSVKGGVGKSTITAMLATALADEGKNVGILDIDITGSSTAALLGVKESPIVSDASIIPPASSKGIKIVGMSLLVGSEKAILWRGPLVSKAVLEMAQLVDFSDRDTIIVDFPPGTSDIPITAYQALPLTGIILITTPQIIAIDIVKKAQDISNLLGINIIGIIENMSYYECPQCGLRTWPFGKRRRDEIEVMLNAPLLAEVPISEEISRLGDAGRIEEIGSKYMKNLAKRLLEK
ncbi:MAG: P-loop NTPase [Candidatus Korarchaeota archaeon]